ncbi:MAG: polyprenyl synthetase family protein [Candidatus Dormibacteria bacterium]
MTLRRVAVAEAPPGWASTAVQHRTAEVVARLSWGRGARPGPSQLGLPARFALRAARAGDREGARTVHVAAAAELTERALRWHRAAACGDEPLGLATLAGDYCLAQAAEALSRFGDTEVESAFAAGLSRAGAELAHSGSADRAVRQLLPACGLAGASAAGHGAPRQASWWRLGRRLAPHLPADTGPVPAALARLRSASDPLEGTLGLLLAADPLLVAGPMADLLSAGGKRIRARLMLLAGELGGRYRPQATLRAAAAMELLHAATLCHDDLVDGADSRRGTPTIAFRSGPMAALGVGDYYLGKSAWLVAQLGDPGISRSVAGALVAIANGQLRELDRRSLWSGALAPYVQVAQAKTGALLVACATTGARLSGAGRAETRAVVGFSRRLGLAFQGIDDCLDFSDPEHTGKPAGTDLAQGICGLPVLCGLRGPHRRQLLEALQGMGEAGPAQAPQRQAEVVELVRQSGALATARSLADNWSMEAVACLAPLASSPRAGLRRFAEQLTLRDS